MRPHPAARTRGRRRRRLHRPGSPAAKLARSKRSPPTPRPPRRRRLRSCGSAACGGGGGGALDRGSISPMRILDCPVKSVREPVGSAARCSGRAGSSEFSNGARVTSPPPSQAPLRLRRLTAGGPADDASALEAGGGRTEVDGARFAQCCRHRPLRRSPFPSRCIA